MIGEAEAESVLRVSHPVDGDQMQNAIMKLKGGTICRLDYIFSIVFHIIDNLEIYSIIL